MRDVSLPLFGVGGLAIQICGDDLGWYVAVAKNHGACGHARPRLLFRRAVPETSGGCQTAEIHFGLAWPADEYYVGLVVMRGPARLFSNGQRKGGRDKKTLPVWSAGSQEIDNVAWFCVRLSRSTNIGQMSSWLLAHLTVESAGVPGFAEHGQAETSNIKC